MVYIEPVHDPALYVRRVVQNAPILLLGQWGLPASELSLFLSASAARVHWLLALVFAAILAVVLVPLLRRDRLALFWATGMLLSLLPACAPFAHDRLLMFVGIGGMGLLAQWLGGLTEGGDWLPSSRAWKRLARVFAALLVVVHLVVAPLVLPVAVAAMRSLGEEMSRQVASLPTDRAFGDQSAVFVNSFSCLTDILMLEQQRSRGRPVPARTLRLSPSCTPATLSRADATTLVVRPRGGYLPPQGSWWGDDPPAFTVSYLMRLMDLLFRSPRRPMALGDRVELTAATVEITALTEDGRPAEATFRFPVPLEHPSLRWLRQTATGFVPFVPPAVGESVCVPSPLAPNGRR